MNTLRTCNNGHQWQANDTEAAPCPVGGVSATVAWEAPAAEAATLPRWRKRPPHRANLNDEDYE